jgi:hypothetical protein
MAQTLCIKCGSELKVSSYCKLCQEPLIFACTSCDYITEEKVHTDCRNAEVLAKTETKEEPAATTTTATTHTTEKQGIKQKESNKGQELEDLTDDTKQKFIYDYKACYSE